MSDFSMDAQKWSPHEPGVDVALASLSAITGENLAVRIRRYQIQGADDVYDLSLCETEKYSSGATAVVQPYDLDAMFEQVASFDCTLDKVDDCTAGYYDEENAEKALMLMLVVGYSYFKPDEFSSEQGYDWTEVIENLSNVETVDFPDENDRGWTPEIV